MTQQQFENKAQAFTLSRLLAIAELDLPLKNGYAKSCDWMPRVIKLAFCDNVPLSDRKPRWLLDFACALSAKVTVNGNLVSHNAEFNGADRIARYNDHARKFTLAIAILARLQLAGRGLAKTTKKELVNVITPAKVLELYKPDHETILKWVSPIVVKNPFSDKRLATYSEMIEYMINVTGKKPSKSLLYREYPKAKSRLYTQDECVELAKHIDKSLRVA